MIDLLERIRIAYKKLKANVYFDKTQLPLRDRIVLYERSAEIEDKLQRIEDALSGETEVWNVFQKELMETVGTFVYPKKLYQPSKDTVIFWKTRSFFWILTCQATFWVCYGYCPLGWR